MSSLAALLRDVADPTPVEIDPEAAFHSLDANTQREEEADGGEPAGPQRGVLRKREARIEDDERYAGRRVSRKEMEEAWNGASSETDQVESQSEEDGESEDKSAGAEFESAEEVIGMDDGLEDRESESEGDDQADSFTEDEASIQPDDLGCLRPYSDAVEHQDLEDEVSQGLSQEDTGAPDGAIGGTGEDAFIRQLKASASADLAKGQAVRKQLAFYDKLLGLRIRMQKVLQAVHELPVTSDEHVGEARDAESTAALRATLALSETLSNVRADALALNEGLDLPSRKRKRSSPASTVVSDSEPDDQPNPDGLEAYACELDAALQPHVFSTLSKWSSKIHAASSASLPLSRKGASVIHQDPAQQLKNIWESEGERARLIKRTKIRRGEAAAGTKVEAVEADIFDDRDFYHSLLKEVVDSSGNGLPDIPSARGARTRRANVDPRASKGRKLRYTVHEKLVDFMVPQGEESQWNHERRDELFAGLLGRGWEGPAVVSAGQPDEPTEVAVEVYGGEDTGQLRIFG